MDKKDLDKVVTLELQLERARRVGQDERARKAEGGAIRAREQFHFLSVLTAQNREKAVKPCEKNRARSVTRKLSKKNRERRIQY